jgi:hypothetical protein
MRRQSAATVVRAHNDDDGVANDDQNWSTSS